ncbi:MAG: carboxylating nicotinate-nucleotide diphosphorylase [Candidatus Omnitrophica bacterium]|nr:carboxylating nicotinate-nucleotide diphosphorylase [Candidatus Omnitrophota bacterium]
MKKNISRLINEALKEDIEKGDVTSRFLFSENFTVQAVLTAKEEGVICGIEIFKKVFLSLSPSFRFRFRFKDGDVVGRNRLTAEIKGPVKEMMAGERTALNFLQHLSGIATLTREFVKKTGGRIDVYDTRKTMPLLRELEKYAVKTGGGKNHRFGLYDMVLIKENHIHACMLREKTDDRAEALYRVVKSAKEKARGRYKVEVEVENFVEARKGYLAGADIIMFDNADKSELKKFVNFLGKNRKKVIIEWSGNVGLDTMGEISRLPVDRISAGSTTHSAKSLDFSLKII